MDFEGGRATEHPHPRDRDTNGNSRTSVSDQLIAERERGMELFQRWHGRVDGCRYAETYPPARNVRNGVHLREAIRRYPAPGAPLMCKGPIPAPVDERGEHERGDHSRECPPCGAPEADVPSPRHDSAS